MLPDKPGYINVAGKLLDLSVPKVMGIINVTPDSFYKGSRVNSDKEIITAAANMIEDGADILDVGGYSSRPNASDISHEEEKKRVLNAISLISREFPGAVISIDTFRSGIADEAVTGCGAHIINDISAGEADEMMFNVVCKLNVPYIMMHMQGNPGTMQKNPVYEDVVADILKWFSPRIVRLQSGGVKDIIIDPGFGFGKTAEHNFELLRRLSDFAVAGLPVLAGVSRKSMIWKTLGITPEEALNGTTVLNAFALYGGADIIRVHDVKEAVQTVRLIEKLKNSGI
ncbi:MAG: dihydropteroate synthase [Bacteroidales bacterium]|jgi:dihydropteroate synthase|nr:dihydropteroate synthase [Bacteroidales bacterium]